MFNLFSNAKFDSIDVNEVKNIKDINLIDVRYASEFNKHHISKSKNIELGELVNNYSKYLDKDKEYYIVCTAGVRSKKACKVLAKAGYNVTNLERGINGYER